MRALNVAAIALVSLVLLGAAYLFSAGRYGMSVAQYTCVGELLPQGGSVAQSIKVRIQQYRWWMHWVRRGGIVFVERPSFIAYPDKYLHMYNHT